MDIEKEGTGIGWHQTGSLGIARSPEFAQVALQNHQSTQYCGVESHVLESWEDVARIHPFLANPRSDFVLGVHSPTDGIVNPADATMALAKRARKAGAEIRERVCVVGMETGVGVGGGEKVTAVVTKCGQRVECGAVVVAGRTSYDGEEGLYDEQEGNGRRWVVSSGLRMSRIF